MIRPATLDDVGKIASVHVNSYRAAYRGVMLDVHLQAFSEATRAKVFAEYVKTGAYSLDVLVLDCVVGFCAYGACRDNDKGARCCELQAIYLEPSVWRRGYGSAMTERVLAYARKRSFTEVVLWVLEANASAKSFYEALGFKPDGASKVLEADGWRATEVRYQIDVGGV